MREKLTVKVEYELNKTKVREHMIQTGEYIPSYQVIRFNFMSFGEEVKHILFESYYLKDGEFIVRIEEEERQSYATFENEKIKTFPIAINTEEERNKMKQEVSWFLRMKEKHGEAFVEQKVSKTYNSPHLYIFYQVDSVFEKKELVEKRKIVNKYLTAEIPLSAIHEEELEMLHYLGYRAEYDSTKRRDGITLNAVDYEIEGVHPSPRYLNKENFYSSSVYRKTSERTRNETNRRRRIQ